MLEMKKWQVRAQNPQDVRIGYQGENLSRKLEIAVDELENWQYKLDLCNVDGQANVLDLARMGDRVSVDLAREHVAVSGLCQAQVRGLDGSRERRSNIFYLDIGASLNALDAFEPLEPSEFSQMEQRLSALSAQTETAAQQAEQAAEIVAQAIVHTPEIREGTWWVFDQETGDYLDTGVTAQGPQGMDGAAGPQGEKGDPGQPGKDGADGASFTIRARYDTLEALLEAHPSGEAGEAYAVGTAESNTIYNWSTEFETWQDLGQLKGPKGDPGEKGEQGEKGDTGLTGSAGAPGKDGVSAYQAACQAGFVGTEQAFNTALCQTPYKLSRPTIVTVQVPVSGWSGQEAPFRQTVACAGATSDTNRSRLTACPNWGNNEQLEAIAQSRVVATGQGADTLTFTAYLQKPTVDLTFQVEVQPL